MSRRYDMTKRTADRATRLQLQALFQQAAMTDPEREKRIRLPEISFQNRRFDWEEKADA